MQILNEINSVKIQQQQWHNQGLAIGFVPTMGNLHQGHLSLIKTAKERCDKVVVSVFVNPLQFNSAQDLQNYPRTLDDDIKLLSEVKVDLLFSPEISEIYPEDMQQHTQVFVPVITEQHCGKYRPGHFQGVATIVAKLFNIVQPTMAFFGKKDFQQLRVIEKMCQDLCFNTQIMPVNTVREQDGLAMSSRNRHLNAAQRALAPNLYQLLLTLKEKIKNGNKDFMALSQDAITQLTQAGFKVDYVNISDAENLQLANKDTRNLVILLAASLGSVRLIDNVDFTL